MWRIPVLIGRILLCGIFLMSAANKLMHWNDTVAQVEAQNLPTPGTLLIIAAALELVGGVLVLLGWWTRFGALCLILFLVPVTGIMHDFWAHQGQEMQTEMINFMKNVTIIGGLLVLLGSGPGCLSVDTRKKKKKKSDE